ncbi:MAG: carboxypeptidase regulatory-like domain-containing protein [Planctomycetes bacterium]|nr:carboxypeptidase regulatory-like domain-containing protein [Planctomycetota bacterium]
MKNRTGNPLAKKTVRLKRISPKKPYAAMNVVTGNDGCYRFTNLKNGTYEIKVNSCNGGGTKTVDVTAGGKVNDVNFQCR